MEIVENELVKPAVISLNLLAACLAISVLFAAKAGLINGGGGSGSSFVSAMFCRLEVWLHIKRELRVITTDTLNPVISINIILLLEM